MDQQLPQHATTPDSPQRPRSVLTRVLLGLVGAALLVTFVMLGNWQAHRMVWKRDLIARATERSRATPVDVLSIDWSRVSAGSDEYRRVHLHGSWLPQHNQRVRAATVLGRGFWLLTPLQIDATHILWVNRGFIDDTAVVSTTALPPAELDGLIRITEPRGTLLQANDPAQDAWYSRDIAALNRTHSLTDAASFFVDASSQPVPSGCEKGQCGDHPVAGLTVLNFPDNHLVYMLTWYALALMVVVGFVIVFRGDMRRQHRKDIHV